MVILPQAPVLLTKLASHQDFALLCVAKTHTLWFPQNLSCFVQTGLCLYNDCSLTFEAST